MGGIVVGAADQPVEGVTVVMTVGKYGPGKRPKNPVGYEMYYEVPSRTGPDGRWRTDSVPPGVEEVNLQLIHPEFVSDGSYTTGARGRSPKLEALRAQADRQVLIKGAKIRGRVLDEKGKPIAGARVADSTRGLSFLDYVWRSRHGCGRVFPCPSPSGRKMSLTVQAAGYQPAMREISAEPDAPPAEIRLAPGRMLRGRVVDPQGRPIPGASLGIPGYGKYKASVSTGGLTPRAASNGTVRLRGECSSGPGRKAIYRSIPSRSPRATRKRSSSSSRRSTSASG